MKYTKQLLVSTVILCNVFNLSCKKTEPKGALQPIHYRGSYNRDFNDLNDTQLVVAQRIGIQPLADRAAAEKMTKRLIHVRGDDNLKIDSLTYSIPFLIPQAAYLLHNIGSNFSDSLKALNAPHYKIIVTSVTRTQEDVKRLRRKNGNSTENSTHTYGTTFDISWRRFMKADEKDTLELRDDQLKMVLAQVLRALKQEKACYVKHEKKQACFHITTRE
jgi:hypothetical protein